MRLIMCGLSAVLLSGCSWLGGFGGGAHHGPQAKSSHYGYGNPYESKPQYRGKHNPCQIFSPQQPIPRGCDPASVTLATPGSQYGGFPQQPNFGAGYGAQYGGQSAQYANQGYGSHAGVAHQQSAQYNPRKQIRKPRWRGSMSLGFEKSISGNLLDFAQLNGLDPVASYNPQTFNTVTTSGTPASGRVTTTTFTANALATDPVTGAPVAPTRADIFAPFGFDRQNSPSISFDDVYSTPLRIAGGVEYILNPRTTVFANAGYSYAEGEDGDVATIEATPYRLVSQEDFIDDGTGTFVAVPGSLVDTITAAPSRQIAAFNYDFTDMERIDLEVGGRHYLNPIVKDNGYKTLTPFVGASVGASYYDAVSYNVVQTQDIYASAFDPSAAGTDFEISGGPNNRVDLYDSQWVPSGQLNAGLEWQLTPKTAMAFETGIRIEGARDYSNGVKGDTNIAIPLTIRGSYNF